MRTDGRPILRRVACGSVPLAAVLICLAGCGDGDSPNAEPTPTPTPVCGGVSFQKLHDFDGANGKYPMGSLAQGSDGTLYGAATQGASDQGLLFKMNTDGTGFAAVQRFATASGSYPRDALWIAGQTLIGTTQMGGVFNRGVVYRVQTDGTGFQLLHSFAGDDGSQPQHGLVQGANGAFYGVALYGGAYQPPSWGRGTIFRINADGSGFVKLHDFGPSEGGVPYGSLVRGSDGVLYGVTVTGGPYHRFFGTVFRVNGDGTGFATIHNFDGPGGSEPMSRLIEGSDGALYGMTQQGGKYIRDPGGADPGFLGYGVVFKLNRDGTGFTKLHDFDSTNGDSPDHGALVQASDGALYGTTWAGGAYDRGVIFKINRDGTGFTKLHDFDGANGNQPASPLLEGADGALYGATSRGGGADFGVLYRYCP
jgi:uncharacterized repeat protein (TIGR03803 family)